MNESHPSVRFPLKGHTAIVTGSGGNIGQAVALTLAAHGADVVINGHSCTRRSSLGRAHSQYGHHQLPS